MASQFSPELAKKDEKMATITTKSARVIPPPLNSLFSIDNLNSTGEVGGRARSCTVTSIDSSSSMGTFSTSITGYGSNNVTPIRPRPMLPSSVSFDSGVEVSPFQLRQFRYGDSMVTNGELNNSGSSVPMTADNRDNDVSANMDDSMEGEDEELISIDHHFTPISVPAHSSSSYVGQTAFSSSSQAPCVFQFPTGNNLASERRANQINSNRLQQSYSMADYHEVVDELNNNDPNFANMYGPAAPAAPSAFAFHSTPAPAAQEMMFDFDEFGDDDVFYNGNDGDQAKQTEVSPMRESRSWHITRPSCIIGEPAAGQENSSRDVLFSEGSSSRRSSTPIPIPGSTSGSSSSYCEFAGGFDSFFDSSLPRNEPSVPQPLTRMPYYHQMAPPLLMNARRPQANSEDVTDSGTVSTTSARNGNGTSGTFQRRTAFGTHFETSCSIITRNLMPSRFSPVPFHGRWYPNPQAVERGHLQQQQNPLVAGLPAYLRFGRLPSSPTYPLRAIHTDFRALTTHFEVDEPEEQFVSSPASTSNYGKLTFFTTPSCSFIFSVCLVLQLICDE